MDAIEKAVSQAKRRLLDLFKRGGEQTAATLAGALSLTDVAIRQHLNALEQQGLVCQRTQSPKGRGRPAILWSLTEIGQGVFPERHAELTVGLIEAAREAVGEEGLKRIVDARAAQQIRVYQRTMPAPTEPLQKRVRALAKLRTSEGYMAEVKRDGPDAYLLIEHHCPICEAAKCCQGLCGAELEVFQAALGSTATIERTQHLLSGDQRCVYRITEITEGC